MTEGGPAEAAFMGVVLFVMFLCLFIGWKTPETVLTWVQRMSELTLVGTAVTISQDQILRLNLVLNHGLHYFLSLSATVFLQLCTVNRHRVFMCLVLVWNVGLVGTTEALSGFSNTGMLAVGALFVVIKGVERSQLADKAARRVFGLRTSISAGIIRMMILCFILSAFLNNTPVVALLIPITRDWARARGFSPSTFLIPLSYSCIMGGLLTVIGTSTNLVVQGLIEDEAKTDPSVEPVGFFEPGYIGVPLGIVGMAYLVVMAPRVLPTRGGLFRYIRDRAKELLTEVQVMEDFPFIGEPAGLVLARLGLPQDNLIKIRRRMSTGILRQMSASLEGSSIIGLSMRSHPGGDARGEGRGAPIDDTSAIMEANQKTFGAESMYSYRMQAKDLWGAADDTNNEKKVAADGNGTTNRLSRKRWSSDADAVNLELGGLLRSKVVKGSPKPENTRASADEATYTDIFPVSATEAIQAGDVLFLSCAQSTMIDFQSVTVSQGLKGLKLLDVSALDLPGHGSEFFECVLSSYNGFVGRSSGRDNSEFAKYYGCSVLAVRSRGAREATGPPAISAPPTASRGSTFFSRPAVVPDSLADEESMTSGPAFDTPADQVSLSTPRQPALVGSPIRGSIHNTNANGNVNASSSGVRVPNEGDNVTETAFKAGDVVLVLAKEEFYEKYSASKDFFLLTKVGSVPKPVRYFDYLPLFAFVGMLVWVLFDADMVQAAFAAGAVLLLGGWVDAKKAVGYVDWGLLLLIGSALGLSKGIVNSGLAGYVGGAIRDSGISADASLFVVYAFTMVCTELITNNAAAALSTPIAFSIARELDVSYKPFVLTVMLAASSSFITPIGYQTNTLVWSPGGYKFTDFMKIGTPLSLIYLVLGSLLIPRVFPF